MEVFISGWWWTSHQSLAHKDLRILRFCIVPWKDEREPSIQHSMVRQIGVVQKFTAMQNFGHNWWWANGIRVEYFPGFTALQLCHKIQELLSRSSVTPEKFTRRIIFMSMFNDILWVSKDNEQECESNAQPRLSICEEDFHQKDGWSFLGPGSEKKWHSTHECKPQG